MLFVWRINMQSPIDVTRTIGAELKTLFRVVKRALTNNQAARNEFGQCALEAAGDAFQTASFILASAILGFYCRSSPAMTLATSVAAFALTAKFLTETHRACLRIESHGRTHKHCPDIAP
jgi:hypothetical protein